MEELAADEGPPEWIGFLKPNITICMVDDFTAHPADKIPDHVRCLLTCERFLAVLAPADS